MNPTEFLAQVHADAERVQFCPHMDWTTSPCSGCRSYRLALAAERLACAVEAVLAHVTHDEKSESGLSLPFAIRATIEGHLEGK